MHHYRVLPVVYILASAPNATLYVGVTSDLVKRVAEHKTKTIPGFTNRYNVTLLGYYQLFDTMELAIMAEKKIKKLSRVRKIKLIQEFNPEWDDLYQKIFS